MKMLLTLLMLLSFVGCQAKDDSAVNSSPRSLVQWSNMDETLKYKTDTLRQLKDSVPEFLDDMKWQQFFIEEVGPNLEKVNIQER